MEQSNSNYWECQKGEASDKVPLSHMKIITPLAEYLKSGQKISASFYEVLHMIYQ